MVELSHRKSVWLALLVTFLWSTSWVLIKFGLKGVPPLTFAGLRYTLASLCLAPLVLLNRSHRETLARISGPNWLRLTAARVSCGTNTPIGR